MVKYLVFELQDTALIIECPKCGSAYLVATPPRGGT
jgi:rRNA maturation protein Nop10